MLAKRAVTDFPGSATVEFGRHKGERGLPVSALLAAHPTAKAIRFQSCGKLPRLVTRGAGARWFLVTNKKGQLKLVNAPGPGVEPEKAFRPVVLVELVERH